MPLAKDPEAHLASAEDLRHADGNGTVRHVLQSSAEVCRAVGGAGLGANVEGAGLEGRELLDSEVLLRLVEGEVAGDANAAIGDVDTAQRLDDLGHVAWILGVGEDALLGRHDQFGVDLAVDHSVHEAAEREAIGGVDPLVVIGEVLVHVDEPAVLEREALVVDHLHEVGVLANGTNRADEDRLGTGGVVLANRTDHVLGHLEKDRRRVTGELEANLGALPQLLRRDVIVVHASSCFRTTRPPRADGGIILLRGDRVSWLDCASQPVPVSYLMVS